MRQCATNSNGVSEPISTGFHQPPGTEWPVAGAHRVQTAEPDAGPPTRLHRRLHHLSRRDRDVAGAGASAVGDDCQPWAAAPADGGDCGFRSVINTQGHPRGQAGAGHAIRPPFSCHSVGAFAWAFFCLGIGHGCRDGLHRAFFAGVHPGWFARVEPQRVGHRRGALSSPGAGARAMDRTCATVEHKDTARTPRRPSSLGKPSRRWPPRVQ